MAGSVEAILAEWRAAERALEDTEDADEREALEARVSELRDEYAAAVAERTEGSDDADQEPASGRDEPDAVMA
jgi:hypothetical protein